MRSKKWVTDIVMSVGVDKSTADMVIERLQEEGVLHLGYGDADVDNIVDAFGTAFNTTKVTRYDRWAAGRLAKAHGSQSVVQLIHLLAANSGKPFCPVVNNLTELENKFQSVVRFLRKNYASSDIIQV
jgi:hypothetical protein